MVFILSALWWIKIRGSWKLPDGRDWLRGKLGLVLMGRAMFNNSLIQFSVDGWGWVPSLLFYLRSNYGGANEDNGNPFQKVPCMHCWTQCPNPAAGHCWPMTLLETSGHSWASLGQSLVGSLPLSPGTWCAQAFVCALQESVSPVLWKFQQLYGVINGDLLQEGLGLTQVCCTQSPCPCDRPLLTHTSTGDPQTQFWFSLLFLVCTSLVWVLWASLAGMGFDFKFHSYRVAGTSPLPLDIGYLFLMGCNILLSTVVQQQVVI